MTRNKFRAEIEKLSKAADDIVNAHLTRKKALIEAHQKVLETLEKKQKEEIEILESQNLEISRCIRTQERMIRDSMMNLFDDKREFPLESSPDKPFIQRNRSASELTFEELRRRYLNGIDQLVNENNDHSASFSDYSFDKSTNSDTKRTSISSIPMLENTLNSDEDDPSTFGKPFKLLNKGSIKSATMLAFSGTYSYLEKSSRRVSTPIKSSLESTTWTQNDLEALARLANSSLNN